MATTSYGESDAARLLASVKEKIFARLNDTVTLSRAEAIDAVESAWRESVSKGRIDEKESAVLDEVFETATRFINSLPLGFPQPEVVAEPDGHINLEWYRSPRRIVSVSVAPRNRLHWAALIGTESPRGNACFIERIPDSILDQIRRVFEGD